MKKDISTEYLILIERYLKDELTEGELINFQNRIETEAGFKEKIKEVNLLIMGIEEAGVREKIEELHSENFDEKKKPKTLKLKTRRILSIAASLLILFGLASFLYFQKMQGNKLYNQYFQPDPGLATVMGSSGNYEFERAMVYYKDKKYKEAVTAWEKQLINKPDNDTLLFFLGHSYQSLGRQNQAQFYLSHIIHDKNSSFVNEANWYYGLSLLKQKKKEEAKIYLKASQLKISEPLLDELNK